MKVRSASASEREVGYGIARRSVLIHGFTSHDSDITPQAVADALTGMVSGVDGASMLESLLVVALAIDEPSAPRTPLLRRMALQRLLMDLIVTKVHQLRRSHGLASYTQPLPLADAVRDIEQVGHQQKSILTGWTWLYYRYVRSELDITPVEFSRYVGVTDRTLRRYADQAGEALAKQLITLEWDARRAQNQRRLTGVLPLPLVRLIGRDSEHRLLRTVLEQAQPPHVQLIGPAGAGKSTFAQAVARSRVVDGTVDELVWLTASLSVAAARRELEELLLCDRAATSLTDFVDRYAVTIVMDGIHGWDVAELQTLLAELASATVFLIGERYIPLEFASARLYIRNLTHQAALELIRLQLTLNYPEEGPFLDDEIETIWRDVGGNPRAIIHAVQQSHSVFR